MSVYTEEHFERMRTDPVLRRQYTWQVAQSAKRRAAKVRASKTKTADEVFWANIDEWFGSFLLENIDRVVETTGG